MAPPQPAAQVKAFLMFSRGIGGDREARPVPNDEGMLAMQRAFEEIIGKVLHRKPFHLGQDLVTTSVLWFGDRPRFVQMPEPNGRPLEALEVYHASCGLVLLIDELYGEARMIKVCDAPKPRARAEERCGRWVVDRPNQMYCSPARRNLANTRATRGRMKQGRRTRHR